MQQMSAYVHWGALEVFALQHCSLPCESCIVPVNVRYIQGRRSNSRAGGAEVGERHLR